MSDVPHDTENSFPDDDTPFFVKSDRRRGRRVLTAVWAILLAIVVNVALLAFIGYVDLGEKPERENEDRWTLRKVNLRDQSYSPPSREREDRSRSKNPEKRAQKQRRRNTPPQPDVSMNPVPLQPIDLEMSLRPTRADFRLRDLNASTPRSLPKRGSSTDEKETSGESGRKGTYATGDLDKLPEKTGGADPEFPLEARRNGTEGWVLLELDVSATGDVTRVRVLDWQGSPLFKKSAREAVREWTFTPGKVNGNPVRATNLRQRITFNLIR